MKISEAAASPYLQRLLDARRNFFERGEHPEGSIDSTVVRSWERCLRFGLETNSPVTAPDSLDRVALKTEQHRNQLLLSQGRPILEHIYDQIRDSGSMVILADANGLLLDTAGDPDFVEKADRVFLQAGASWDENQRGTNAIGTALVEEAAVEILGAEHYFDRNGFLACCASPVFGPDGKLVGVIDISGDYRNYQRHTLGLSRLSAGILERRLFEKVHAHDILIAFHTNPDYLGSPREGLAAVSSEGMVLAVNRVGLEMLGIRRVDAVLRDFNLVFESSLARLVERTRSDMHTPCELHVNGRHIYLRLRGQLPSLMVVGRLYDETAVNRTPRKVEAGANATASEKNATLDSLNTGDARLKTAIERALKVISRDIPIMIQGESGTGKEVFAKAFHHSGPRHASAFVALNCAAIPETLIESELFGYQGGAFTGSRKEGAPGRIQQAHGGTLFLDEIGDMPLHLQARLLRVLQERSITPLGATKAIQVDISLLCATHRNLREEVARGNFREDLYYRLNGLCISMPPLRERSDIRELVKKFALEETAAREQPVVFSEDALLAMENYAWPGNIRQMVNVIRVVIALLDDHETLIERAHLPEELFESPIGCALDVSPGNDTMQIEGAESLQEIGRQVALRALEAAGGNVSAAARRLGISRNTLYRKIGRL